MNKSCTVSGCRNLMSSFPLTIVVSHKAAIIVVPVCDACARVLRGNGARVE